MTELQALKKHNEQIQMLLTTLDDRLSYIVYSGRYEDLFVSILRAGDEEYTFTDVVV